MAITGRKNSSSPTYVRLDSSDKAKAESFVRKGYVPVLVGTDNEAMERLSIPIKLFNHHSLVSLLDQSVQEFGYRQDGLLRILCDAENFKEMIKNISRRP